MEAKTAIAHNPLELVEHGVPDQDSPIAWRGPWTYFKAVPKFASAAHPEAEEGEIVGWQIGEFVVYTNHEKCTSRQRYGLQFTQGEREQPPEDFDVLKAWMLREGLKVDGMTPTRPELPPFAAQEVASE